MNDERRIYFNEVVAPDLEPGLVDRLTDEQKRGLTDTLAFERWRLARAIGRLERQMQSVHVAAHDLGMVARITAHKYREVADGLNASLGTSYTPEYVQLMLETSASQSGTKAVIDADEWPRVGSNPVLGTPPSRRGRNIKPDTSRKGKYS